MQQVDGASKPQAPWAGGVSAHAVGGSAVGAGRELSVAAYRALDHLVAADLTARGVIEPLFEAAAQHAASVLGATSQGASLLGLVSQAVAARLLGAGYGARVVLATGFPSRSWLFEGLTETDGPVGAAVLARVLEEAWGAVPVVVTEGRLIPYAQVSLRACGLILGSLDQALASKPGPPTASVAAVVPFPSDPQAATAQAERLLDTLQPAVAIAVEMPGRGVDGRYHNVSGREVPSNLVADADRLFMAARRRGVLTVGIGDGGNELGMGNISETVARVVPQGELLAARTPVDLVVAASVSNLGAFALAAALAARAGRPDVLDAIDVGRVIERCADAGAVDGLSARPDPLSDGTPVCINRALWEIMRFSVRQALKGWVKQ